MSDEFEIELDAANAFPYDSDATVEPDSEEEVQDQAEEIREFFTNNPRFRFKKIIAHGSYGATFQAQLVDPKIPKIKDFIVKRAFDDEYARDQMSTEKRILGTLRGNKHIVQMLDIPNNPFEDNLMEDEWMIQEWIPRGDLDSFMKNFTPGHKFPSRLLWSFCLCLIRACIAMGWPNGGERPQPGEAQNLTHGDMHFKNILIDDPPADGEHTIAPLLKLIDFGQAGPAGIVASGEDQSAEQENVFDIGHAMYLLMVDVGYTDTLYATFEWQGKKIQTKTPLLIPAPQGIDPDLCSLVCRASAASPGDRPTLAEMLEIALRKLAAPVGDDPAEQDGAILGVWRDILYNASTAGVEAPTERVDALAERVGAPAEGAVTQPEPVDVPTGGDNSILTILIGITLISISYAARRA